MLNTQNDCVDNREIKPKGIAYGAASLTRVLNGVAFPITTSEIVAKYGDREVNYCKGNTRTLAQIIAKCGDERFYTMSELVEACARRPLNRT